MASHQSVSGQGPSPIDGDGTQNSPGVRESDQGGGQPGKGQRGGGRAGKSPTSEIAGKDGPQTGGHERGNPGVGG